MVCKVCASMIRAVSFSHVFFSFTRKMPFLGSPSDIGSERERVKFDQIRRLLDYVHGRSLKICSNFRMLSDWLVPFERGISLSEECYNLAFTQQYKNKDRSLHRSKGVVIKISVTLIFGQVFAAHHSDLLTTSQFPDQISVRGRLRTKRKKYLPPANP